MDGKPLVLRLNNPFSDNILITGCSFNIGGTPHPCTSPKWKKYSKKILVNGYNIIMDEFSGTCFAADNVAQGPSIVSSNSMQRKVTGS